MKKIINNPNNVVSEMLQGLAKANPAVVYLGEGVEVIARREKKQGKVGLVSGGGSGHEPAHAGYVGKGCWTQRWPAMCSPPPPRTASWRASRRRTPARAC